MFKKLDNDFIPFSNYQRYNLAFRIHIIWNDILITDKISHNEASVQNAVILLKNNKNYFRLACTRFYNILPYIIIRTF